MPYNHYQGLTLPATPSVVRLGIFRLWLAPQGKDAHLRLQAPRSLFQVLGLLALKAARTSVQEEWPPQKLPRRASGPSDTLRPPSLDVGIFSATNFVKGKGALMTKRVPSLVPIFFSFRSFCTNLCI